MLIEVKVKVSRIIDGKTRKRTETYIVDGCELFTNAEYRVMTTLTHEQEDGYVESFEIQSLRISPIKEVCNSFNGAFQYIVTLKDLWLADDGTEKELKYKVLLDAEDLSDATDNARQLARQGYEMQIEGIKQVDYEYLQMQLDPEGNG